MRALAPFLIVLVLGGLVVAGCTGPAASTGDGDAFPADYQRVVRPAVEVLDASGHPIGNPFYGGFNTPRPQFVDIDGDGDDDLFVQERSDQLTFFEHVTDGDSSRLVWRTDDYSDLSIGEWFRFVDLDQDGVPDLLAEEQYSHIRAYRNTGTATDAAFDLVTDTLRTPDGAPIFSDRQNIPNVADLDCDGRLDLFLGRLDGTITHYEAVGSTGMPTFAHVTDNFAGIEIVNRQLGIRHGANTLTFGDIDDDGALDLFWGDFFEPGLLLIENTGSCSNPILSGEPEPFPPSNPLKTSGYNAPVLTDWTGNGRLDLFVGVLGGANDANTSLTDNFYFYEHRRDGYTLRTKQFTGGLDVGSESSVAVGDLDGDGTDDLLLANKVDPTNGATSRVYRLAGTRADGGRTYERDGALDLPKAYHYAPALGDLTGTDAADLVLGTWKGGVSIYRNTGDGTFAQTDVHLDTDARHTTPALGDLTGNGRLDLVVGRADGGVDFYRNTGSAQAPAFEHEQSLLSSGNDRSRSAPALHDVDDDGTLDLLIGTRDGLFIAKNTGSPSTPAFEATPSPVSLSGVPRLAAPATGDLDGDTRMDLVMGIERGGLVLMQPAPEN